MSCCDRNKRKKMKDEVQESYPSGARCQKCMKYGHWTYQCSNAPTAKRSPVPPARKCAPAKKSQPKTSSKECYFANCQKYSASTAKRSPKGGCCGGRRPRARGGCCDSSDTDSDSDSDCTTSDSESSSDCCADCSSDSDY